MALPSTWTSWPIENLLVYFTESQNNCRSNCIHIMLYFSHIVPSIPESSCQWKSPEPDTKCLRERVFAPWINCRMDCRDTSDSVKSWNCKVVLFLSFHAGDFLETYLRWLGQMRWIAILKDNRKKSHQFWLILYSMVSQTKRICRRALSAASFSCRVQPALGMCGVCSQVSSMTITPHQVVWWVWQTGYI